jgi:hypothetical protein
MDCIRRVRCSWGRLLLKDDGAAGVLVGGTSGGELKLASSTLNALWRPLSVRSGGAQKGSCAKSTTTMCSPTTAPSEGEEHTKCRVSTDRSAQSVWVGGRKSTRDPSKSLCLTINLVPPVSMEYRVLAWLFRQGEILAPKIYRSICKTESVDQI